MTEKRITQKDLAQHLGVNRSTITRALKNDPQISPVMRQKVKHLAKKLGYHLDPNLSQLMAQIQTKDPSKQIRTLAVWNPMEHPISESDTRLNYDFREVFAGAKKQALTLGYQLEEFWKGTYTPKRLASILRHRSAQGLLMLPSYETYEFDCDLQHLSVVSFDYFTTHAFPVHRILHDTQYAMEFTLHKAHELGFKSPALICPATPSKPTAEIIRGTFESIYTHYNSLTRNQKFPYFVVDPDDSRQIKRMVRSIEKIRPDHIITYHGHTLEKMFDNQLPDNTPVFDFSLKEPQDKGPGIRPPSRAIGACAIRKIISMIHTGERGIPEFPETIYIRGTWETP
ncbi:LacI family DNA-binding transcriptional regulator [Pontiella sulfatireligans]|uniref:HTH lacI-type domain-containing protein n=1 Tax=Pontiella sulfatireligans TaxID=2750658 RepID=A0A6C2UJH1_9BACT|nr:LacI family DNA-binding transcriptional regulator [Pontiella sulfatireligans]VGO19561.1 hypothetical protein SCARR_01620 [Pontiella sulfatireligans]